MDTFLDASPGASVLARPLEEPEHVVGERVEEGGLSVLLHAGSEAVDHGHLQYAARVLVAAVLVGGGEVLAADAIVVAVVVVVGVGVVAVGVGVVTFAESVVAVVVVQVFRRGARGGGRGC